MTYFALGKRPIRHDATVCALLTLAKQGSHTCASVSACALLVPSVSELRHDLNSPQIQDRNAEAFASQLRLGLEGLNHDRIEYDDGDVK